MRSKSDHGRKFTRYLEVIYMLVGFPVISKLTKIILQSINSVIQNIISAVLVKNTVM